MPASIDDQYQRADAAVGAALPYADDGHAGHRPERPRLRQLSALRRPERLAATSRDCWPSSQASKPGHDAGDLLQGIDWSRTQAYAVGLGGIYLNLQGREGQRHRPPRRGRMR